MYKLLIADDEPMIREGLRDLVNWEGLGYEIAGVFNDGAPVIEYLKKYAVDAIVTDIKMSICTGLDIAKYVRENKLHTKIILISGYKEIDLAMSAIKFNVCEYILKPIDITQLENQLRNIHELLVEEQKSRSNQYVLEYYQKSISELKNDFFLELTTGSFTNEKYVSNVFQLIYPNLNLYDCPCFLVTIIFNNYTEYMKSHWKHTNGELYGCLQNCISLSSEQVEYRMICKSYDTVQLFGIVNNQAASSKREIIEQYNSNLCRTLNEIFFIDAVPTDLEIYDNILKLSLSRNSFKQQSVENHSFLLKLKEQEKMLYSTIGIDNGEKLENIIRKLIGYLQDLDFSIIQSIILEMFTVFQSKLMESGIDCSNSLLTKTGKQQVNAAQNLEELQQVLYAIFVDLSTINKVDSEHENEIIEKAKKYITDHITEDISLEDISEKFYLSQYYFSRTFKSKTGENLIDYIIAQKIEKAKQLLRDPRHTVCKISNIVGYKSNRYFTKVFKNHTGYTPSEYRNRFYSDAGGDAS